MGEAKERMKRGDLSPKGFNYKLAQKKDSMVRVYDPARYREGERFKMSDGQEYVVAQGGNFVRVR